MPKPKASFACYKDAVSTNGGRASALILAGAIAFAAAPSARAQADAPATSPPARAQADAPAPPPSPPAPPPAAPEPYQPPADAPAPLPPPAHLEAPPTFAGDVRVEELPPPFGLTRPRLTIAIGMGATFESTGLVPARTEPVPAFFATGGVGADWPVGVELGAYASSASGRFMNEDQPLDRLALAAMGVVRPGAWPLALDDGRYGARCLRALGVELGLGIERDGTTVRAGSRWGLHTGARVELPLGPAGARKELRLRLGARRFQGFYTPQVGLVTVENAFDIYAALVSVF
jgi:hypothetical protein